MKMTTKEINKWEKFRRTYSGVRVWSISMYDSKTATNKILYQVTAEPQKWIKEKSVFMKNIWKFDDCKVINTTIGGFVLRCTRSRRPRLQEREVHFYLQKMF